MSQPPTDILRELHGAADRAGLACTRTGNFRVAMIDAAHLRAAAAEIERLRKERDQARRSVCEMSIQLGGVYRRIGGKVVEVTTPEGCAEIMQWDCYKENTDD